MVSKTRDKLLEVARHLFMVKGVEHTTMNDIAAASERGRRTIYTYFKSKREIFQAVIERESETVISQLRAIVESDLSPRDKLHQYLTTRFDILASSQQRGRQRPDRYLTGIFARDSRRGERIYQLALAKEADLFESLLRAGVEAGVFDAEQARRLPTLLHHINVAAVTQHQMPDTDNAPLANRHIIDFIISGVVTRDTNQ